jgi:peptidoglycan/xylan/chitin deacetylase (PgdA/CDA1 family)
MQWKDNAACAVMVTVNLDAEYFWLSLSPDCIDRPKTLSMGEYGMNRGLPRLLEVLEKYRIKSTFFVPGLVSQKYEIQIKEIVSRGHEIACHGYEHENFALLSKEEQEEGVKKALDLLREISGQKVIGFRAPEGELTLETLEIAKKNGILYSSNLSDDDRPYYLDVGGERILEIPIHWDLFDFPYFGFNYGPAFPSGQGRIANYTQVLENWINEYKGYKENGLCYVLQLDPQTIGTPGRIGLLEELLSHMKQDENIWFVNGEEMYQYYEKKLKR